MTQEQREIIQEILTFSNNVLTNPSNPFVDTLDKDVDQWIDVNVDQWIATNCTGLPLNHTISVILRDCMPRTQLFHSFEQGRELGAGWPRWIKSCIGWVLDKIIPLDDTVLDSTDVLVSLGITLFPLTENAEKCIVKLNSQYSNDPKIYDYIYNDLTSLNDCRDVLKYFSVIVDARRQILY
jgi:hypothetical protein